VILFFFKRREVGGNILQKELKVLYKRQRSRGNKCEKKRRMKDGKILATRG
jgi:hypothetical protein